MTDRIRFGLIGAGWRSDFFLRIARLMPDRFEVACVQVRNPAKGKAYAARWRVPVVETLPELLAVEDLEFVVVSVSQPAAAAVIGDVVAAGMPVLTETPPGRTLAELEALTALSQQGAHIQVAEQYQFQPMHAARIAVAASGLIGDVTQVQVSAAHGYHGVSLMRLMLGAGFADAEIQAVTVESQLLAGRGRVDPPPPDRLDPSHQTLALFRFSTGQTGLFDFTGDQYFSWVRAPRVLIRGTRGEILQDTVAWLADSRTPLTLPLRRVDAGHGGNLEGFHHKGIQLGEEWAYHNPTLPGRLADDEIAVADCLLRMSANLRSGGRFYDLAQGAQDQYLSLLMDESVRTGQSVRSSRQAWATEA